MSPPDFESGPQETLLDGASVDIEVKSWFYWWFRQVKVDDATITRANISASNGIIHRINKVLDPGFERLPSIYEIAKSNPDFSILASLLEQAGFSGALDRDYYQLTAFAPTNAAFEALGAETLEAVQGDIDLLRTILKNHLAREALDSTTLAAAGSVRTLLGLDLVVAPDSSSPTGLSIDGKPIAAADIKASNGIVHVVGEVLVPPAPKSLVDVASEREDLSTFVFALGEAGLAEEFDSTEKWPAFTIFAPNNGAFAALPDGVLDALLSDPTGALADVLKLHVVRGRLASSHLYDGQVLYSLSGEKLTVSIEGSEVRINNALVAETDLRAENGIIHILNDVIASDPFTVADFVTGSRVLTTLEAALDAAMLTEVLDDPDADLTLFAPLDSAFANLPEGTLESLLADPSGALTDILKYHVVGESLTAEELTAAGTVATLLGPEVEITERSFNFWGWKFPYSIVKVNGIRVVVADVQTDNGVVHIISGVLLPPASE
jgi:uncharacterized surface protein with fasciclin (FAS1) repeats